ncbi:MAG: hypothetical protein ACYTFY_11935 [Planctomycetota bacterium]
MNNLNNYWGDFHKHLEDTDNIDEILKNAKVNVDFYPVLCYPFSWDEKNGLKVESVQNRPCFLETFEKIKEGVKRHNDPGYFVTFPAYEWHGNRRRWGDHNVIYFEEDAVLDDTWELPDLYENLKTQKAFAIPHHTAYEVARRGKDWSCFDEKISPVMEVYSAHGSSESIDSPVPMFVNYSMGPRVSEGTLISALDQGLHVGVVGSNDGAGLAGAWGRGIAAIKAKELTRESLWEAISNRCCYASTGDKIELDYNIDSAEMGSIIKSSASSAQVGIKTAQPLDRIEIIHNGVVADTYCHRGSWERNEYSKDIYKVLIQCGGGPGTSYGFESDELIWKGSVKLEGGTIKAVQPRLYALGQDIQLNSDNTIDFLFKTNRAYEGMIVEFEGDPQSVFTISTGDFSCTVKAEDLIRKAKVFPLYEESKARIKDAFNFGEEDVKNHDVFYANSGKIRVGQLCPTASLTNSAIWVS